MWVRSTCNIVPSLFRCVALSRVSVMFSQTAVRCSPIISYLTSTHILTKGSNRFQFVRSLSTSCPASFHATNCSYIDCDHSTKIGSSANAVSSAKSKMSQAQRMKQTVREYGATVIVFHTCISLFSLGVSYAAVSSGVDVVGLLGKVGVGQSLLESKITTGASTFVIAYAVHKLFVPARMALTLTATPLIVRYLRRIGFLKQPASKL